MFGDIPEDLFDCTNLEILDLAWNNFSGPIKPSIGKLSNLKRLQLHVNSFTGQIPPEMGNLSCLFDLQLEMNRFSGRVPPQLSKLSLLQGLSLHDNSLKGEIPQELFQLKRLTLLELQNNQFTGPIPDSISEVELLSTLNLSGNKFNLSIPTSLSKLTHLTLLDLSHNDISGSIPGSVIASMEGMQNYLNLSHNYLSGTVPEDIGSLEMVQAIDMSNNNLSGQVPTSLTGCRNLFVLDMSGNKLSGPLQEQVFINLDSLTSLNLSKNQINGQIPASLANLMHLNTLDLSHNQLDGGIPEKLGSLSNLRCLNLSYNQLEGAVSGNLRNKPGSSFEGNKGLCGTKFLGSCTKNSNYSFHGLSKKALLILIPLISASVLLLLALVSMFYKRRTQKIKQVETPEEGNAAALTIKRFIPSEIETATDHFSKDRVIGASNLSTVYKGRLEENGQVVAIKKLNLQQFAAESDKCFNREAKILSQLRHRNLVKVIGYAWESRKLKALVLEYMENGNLEQIIHGSSTDGSKWRLSQTIQVCISVAEGLAYLHSGYDFPIIHCDLKPSNILLDGDWEAHVSDFGTARMLGVHLNDGSNISSASAFEGTIGYMAPEFAYMRTVTTKVDIFSFGVIIMEFLTKRRPTDTAEVDGLPVTLNHIVEKAIAEGKILHVIDPALASTITEDQEEILEEILQLALSCTCPAPENRPDINYVLSSLIKLNKHYLVSKS